VREGGEEDEILAEGGKLPVAEEGEERVFWQREWDREERIFWLLGLDWERGQVQVLWESASVQVQAGWLP
jgi:hypothetical protein